jgi:hypothetical protein
MKEHISHVEKARTNQGPSPRFEWTITKPGERVLHFDSTARVVGQFPEKHPAAAEQPGC